MQCATPCSLDPLHKDDGQVYMSGPCGCIGPEGNCNEEFTGGIVKEICSRMGDLPVAVSAQGRQLPGTFRRTLDDDEHKFLSLRAAAE